MSITIRAFACCSLIAMAGASIGYAQERSAASSLETQMTWSTLSKLVEAANSNSAAANARVDQVAKCNLNYKLYAPEGKKKGLKVDGDGCIFNQPLLDLTARVEDIDDKVDETNKKLDELEKFTKAEIKRIDGSVASLTTKLGELTSRVKDAEGDIKDLGVRVKKIEDQMVVVNGKIASLTGTVENHETRLTKAEGTIKTHTSDIKDINADIVVINKDIVALEKDVAALDDRMSGVETDMAKVLNCGKQDKLYNPTSKKCVNAVADVEEKGLWINKGDGACVRGTSPDKTTYTECAKKPTEFSKCTFSGTCWVQSGCNTYTGHNSANIPGDSVTLWKCQY